MADLVRRTDATSLHVIDGVVLLWVLLWLAIGAWVGYTLWGIASLGDTLGDAGRTLGAAGQLLQRAGDIPIIGDRSRALGDDVRGTAAEIIAQGRRSAELGRQLSILLSVTVVVATLAPVLLPYVPARIARSREVRRLLHTLRTAQDTHALDAHLAQRALLSVPLDRLPVVTLSHPPDGDGRTRALADAELARLGLRRDDRAPTAPRPNV
jgi:hypothetical protein